MEVEHGGGERVLAPEGRHYVDINSVIDVTPNPTALLSATSEYPESIRGLAAEVDELKQLTDDLFTTTQQVATTARAFMQNPDDQATDSGYREAVAAHGALVISILVDFLLPRAGEDAVNNALSSPDYDGLGRLLRSQIALLGDRLTEEMEAFIRDRNYKVRMWAIRYSPGRGPQQVHLAGYDELPVGNPNIVDKLSFARSPDEEARLRSDAAGFQQLLDEVPETFERLSATLTTDLNTMFGRLRQELIDVGQRLRPLVELEPLSALRDALEGEAQADTLREALANLVDGVAPLADFEGQRLRLVQELTGQSDPTAGFDVLAPLLREAVDTLRSIGDAAFISTLTERTDTFAEAARQGLAGLSQEIATDLRTIIDETLPRWREALAALGELDSVQQLALLFGDLRKVFGPATELSTGAEVEVTPEALITTRLADSAATTIDFTTIDRRDGDRVILHLQILDSEGRDVLFTTETSFSIRTFGWHRRWSAGLAFAYGFQEDKIRPGVSTSWIVHHRGRPKRRADGTARGERSALHPLDLGIGITSIVFTRDSGIQFGLGGVVSLFGDALVIGGGHNLQAQEWFVVVSTPLFDLARRFADGDNGQ